MYAAIERRIAFLFVTYSAREYYYCIQNDMCLVLDDVLIVTYVKFEMTCLYSNQLQFSQMVRIVFFSRIVLFACLHCG